MVEMRRFEGKHYPSKGSVFVKIEFARSKASMGRLGSAIIDLGLEVTSTHVIGGAWVTVMVKTPIEHIDEIIKRMGTVYVNYSSPTFFSNSSIQSIYASAEDEIADICTDAYARFLNGRDE